MQRQKDDRVVWLRRVGLARAQNFVSRSRSRYLASSRKSRAKEDFYRRAPFLVLYWSHGLFVVENFLTCRRVTCNPLASTILHFFDRYRPVPELFAAVPDYTPASLRKSVRMLARYTLLQRRGEKLDGEQRLTAWSEWNPAAGFFHLSTKDVEFERDAAKELQSVVQLAQSKPMPRPVKRYPKAQQIRLPALKVDGEFPRVLLARRTWRKFSRRPVTLLALGNLLGLTWGVRRWVDIPKVGSVAVKTSPSGGALHPIEAYVLARSVVDLKPGLYHYSGADHRLELIQGGATSRQIARYLANQWWYGQASFVVFMTAVFARTQWKYDYARAYRAVLMEAGHLCQTFCLTATWLGLAPFCTLAFADSEIERALGVDGISESVLYAAGCGMRPEKEEKAHLLSGSEISTLNL
jgi:SagB-type dehydrogenase family enzyme